MKSIKYLYILLLGASCVIIADATSTDDKITLKASDVKGKSKKTYTKHTPNGDLVCTYTHDILGDVTYSCNCSDNSCSSKKAVENIIYGRGGGKGDSKAQTLYNELEAAYQAQQQAATPQK